MLIEFTKDFATKNKGDILELDGMIGRDLINKKVAKLRERKARAKKEKNEPD